MNKETIAIDAIPHRDPFLFVDEVVSVSCETIETRKHVDANADFFKGHYPGRPIMPGVLLCECCFQAGALLMAHRLGKQNIRGVPVVTKIASARFRRMVLPGDDLTVQAELDDELEAAYYLTARASVDNQLAVRVSFVCMLVDD